ncbi:zona pellucida glycoprotein 3b precursor [Silurus asotus]|uniref:Zona pellucida glycoprotein 3b n=1 Tax=Silurus asotus TaxID=30991 RepID=A0AAD5FHI1_SILAS|nr:zona pellucida glycoprotein 3b precursor [Silurus asotus]
MCCCAEWLALSAALLLLTGGARGIRVCKEEGPRVVADVRPIKALGFRPEDCVQPVAVSVHCTENSMMIRARADLYGTGRLVTASELRLGTDSSAENCGAVQREDTELVITAGLHECGAELRVSTEPNRTGCVCVRTLLTSTPSEGHVEDDSLVYSNTLFHVPTLNRFGIIRSVGVAIPVQCRYKSMDSVCFTSFYCTVYINAHDSDNYDWMSLSLMDVFQSDDGVSVMASVLSARHSPVKLFLQHCVMFITCWMKTADSVQEKNSVKKACSYVGNRNCCTWRTKYASHPVNGGASSTQYRKR